MIKIAFAIIARNLYILAEPVVVSRSESVIQWDASFSKIRKIPATMRDSIQSGSYVTTLSPDIIVARRNLEQIQWPADIHESYRSTLTVFRPEVKLLCSSTSGEEGASSIRSDTRGVGGPLLREWPRQCRRSTLDRRGTTWTSWMRNEASRWLTIGMFLLLILREKKRSHVYLSMTLNLFQVTFVFKNQTWHGNIPRENLQWFLYSNVIVKKEKHVYSWYIYYSTL